MDPSFIAGVPSALPGFGIGLCHRRPLVPSKRVGWRRGAVILMAGRGRKPRRSEEKAGKAEENESDRKDQKTRKEVREDVYVPLHVHSHFSLLDGASQLDDLVARAVEMGIPALALTDHGVLYGAIQLIKACAKRGIKPIIGNEMYVVNGDIRRAQDASTRGIRKYHLIVLAKNTVGYRNLVKLTSIAHLEGMRGKGIFARPCVNKALLYEHREGLIVTSACLGGEIAQALLNDDFKAAERIAQWFKDVFLEDFYLEIQDHGDVKDRIVNRKLVELSGKLNIPLIVTNDSHFTSALDAPAHDALICLQTGKLLDHENRLRYSGNEFFKSPEQLRSMFTDHLPLTIVDEAMRNTLKIADKIDSYDILGSTRIPDFPLPDSHGHTTHEEYLESVAKSGLLSILDRRKGCVADRSASACEKDYFSRLEYELKMIIRMGFTNYFLVVWDYISFARRAGIPVGPGRGSVAGSLVAYALGITGIDPVEHGLLFERFLNPDRKSMPDIDTDFSIEGREKVIEYVTSKYGADRVAQIVTFNRLTAKAVIKDVARVHGIPYALADKLAKSVPVIRGTPTSLSDLTGANLSEGCDGRGDGSEAQGNGRRNQTKEGRVSYKDFRAIYKRKDVKEWVDKARRIEGVNKSASIHAAGVVISSTPLTDVVPLSRAKHGETITQYPMEDVESVGLLKMDFLGLKNLSVIEAAVQLINKRPENSKYGSCGKVFDIDDIPLDDPATYDLLAHGSLDGIFQLDASEGMRSVVRELAPTSLSDISSVLALYRPGPLDAGLIPKFIARKHGREPIVFAHDLLAPILGETYGILVYQEQIMSTARAIAGYTMAQADILRRAMGKKKAQEMAEEQPRFIAGAVKNGVNEAVAVRLFEEMKQFAHYCFNKSHSTAYAYLTYQTAYLKANFGVEYMAALLAASTKDGDKLQRFLASAASMGVCVHPPDINHSRLGFTVVYPHDSEPAILFGLSAVVGVGESVGKAIITEREQNGEFGSIIELCSRLRGREMNKKALEALIHAGAFDGLHGSRKALMNCVGLILECRKKSQAKRRSEEKKRREEPVNVRGNNSLVNQSEEWRVVWEGVEIELQSAMEQGDEWSLVEKLRLEKDAIGYYASAHPLQNLKKLRRFVDCLDVSAACNSTVDDEVVVLGLIEGLNKLTTSKGSKMAKFFLEDAQARIPSIVFPGSFALCQQKSRHVVDGSSGEVVESGARVLVWGKVSKDSSNEAQLIVDDIIRIEDIRIVAITIPQTLHREKTMGFIKSKISQIADYDADSRTDYNERFGRRRNTNFDIKPRIPVVVRREGSEGKTGSCVSLGPRFRCRNPEKIKHIMEHELELGATVVNFNDIVALDHEIKTESNEQGGILDEVAKKHVVVYSEPTALPKSIPVEVPTGASQTEISTVANHEQIQALDKIRAESGEQAGISEERAKKKHAVVRSESAALPGAIDVELSARASASERSTVAKNAETQDLYRSKRKMPPLEDLALSEASDEKRVLTSNSIEPASTVYTKQFNGAHTSAVARDPVTTEKESWKLEDSFQRSTSGSTQNDKSTTKYHHRELDPLRRDVRARRAKLHEVRHLRRQRDKGEYDDRERRGSLPSKELVNATSSKFHIEREYSGGMAMIRTRATRLAESPVSVMADVLRSYGNNTVYASPPTGGGSSGPDFDRGMVQDPHSVEKKSAIQKTLSDIKDGVTCLIDAIARLDDLVGSRSTTGTHKPADTGIRKPVDNGLASNLDGDSWPSLEESAQAESTSNGDDKDQSCAKMLLEIPTTTETPEFSELKDSQDMNVTRLASHLPGPQQDVNSLVSQLSQAGSPGNSTPNSTQSITREHCSSVKAEDPNLEEHSEGIRRLRKSQAPAVARVKRVAERVEKATFAVSRGSEYKLLDAACFVAANVASRYADQPARTVMVSCLKMINETASHFEAVCEGRIANIRGELVDVLVTIREASPSETRKRRRTVARFLVTLQCEGALPSLGQATKTLKKAKECVSQELRRIVERRASDGDESLSSARSDILKEVAGGSYVASDSRCESSLPGHGESVCGGDGGQLLMWMCQLAVLSGKALPTVEALTPPKEILAVFEHVENLDTKKLVLSAQIFTISEREITVRVILNSPDRDNPVAWASFVMSKVDATSIPLQLVQNISCAAFEVPERLHAWASEVEK